MLLRTPSSPERRARSHMRDLSAASVARTAPLTLSSLPEPCLENIFDALSGRPATAGIDAEPAATLARVCRRLRHFYQADHITALHTRSNVPADLAAALLRYPRVSELLLQYQGRVLFDLAAALGAAPAAARAILHVNLRGAKLMPGAVRQLVAACPHLHTLSIPDCSPIDDADLQAVVDGLASTLSVLACGVTGKELGDASGVGLAKLTSLSSLSLYGCIGFTDVTYRALASLGGTLNELYLSDTRISDAAGEVFRHLPRLRTLDLAGCMYLSSAVLPHLPPSLLTLNIQVTSILEDGVAPSLLGGLPQLSDLDTGYAENLTSWVPLESVAQRLRVLDVSLSALSDGPGARAVLSSMRNLRHLNLSYCSAIGDEAAKGASEIPRLESLAMSFTRISDVGARALGNAACRDTLRELNISCCDLILDREAALDMLTSYFAYDVSSLFKEDDDIED